MQRGKKFQLSMWRMDFGELPIDVLYRYNHRDKSSGGRKKVRLKTQRPSVKHINLRNVLRKSLMSTGRLRQKLFTVALLAAVRNCHQLYPVTGERQFYYGT